MIYLHLCPYCKEPKPHRVQIISIRKGLKLMCLKCGTPQEKYINAKRLIEHEFNPEDFILQKGGETLENGDN